MVLGAIRRNLDGSTAGTVTQQHVDHQIESKKRAKNKTKTSL